MTRFFVDADRLTSAYAVENLLRKLQENQSFGGIKVRTVLREYGLPFFRVLKARYDVRIFCDIKCIETPASTTLEITSLCDFASLVSVGMFFLDDKERIESAVAAAQESDCTVAALVDLTSNKFEIPKLEERCWTALKAGAGKLIMPYSLALRATGNAKTGSFQKPIAPGIILCPGIRAVGSNFQDEDQVKICTPMQAITLDVDGVLGRMVTRAEEPHKAFQALVAGAM